MCEGGSCQMSSEDGKWNLGVQIIGTDHGEADVTCEHQANEWVLFVRSCVGDSKPLKVFGQRRDVANTTFREVNLITLWERELYRSQALTSAQLEILNVL